MADYSHVPFMGKDEEFVDGEIRQKQPGDLGQQQALPFDDAPKDAEPYPPADVAGFPWLPPEQEAPALGPDFRPNAAMRDEMRNYLVGRYGPSTVDALGTFPGEQDPAPEPYDIRTASGMFIYEVLLPRFLKHFFDKNADYGDQHRSGLGLKGEFVGLHRKMAKLQKAVWDEEELVGEQVPELLYDLIGTALLMLDLEAQGT